MHSKTYYVYLHRDFENTEKSQSSQHRQPKGTSLGFKMRPNNLEDAAGDHNTVKAVKGGLKVYPWSQCPHTQEHFKDEHTQEDILGPIWL